MEQIDQAREDTEQQPKWEPSQGEKYKAVRPETQNAARVEDRATQQCPTTNSTHKRSAVEHRRTRYNPKSKQRANKQENNQPRRLAGTSRPEKAVASDTLY